MSESALVLVGYLVGLGCGWLWVFRKDMLIRAENRRLRIELARLQAATANGAHRIEAIARKYEGHADGN